jgi:membrane protein
MGAMSLDSSPSEESASASLSRIEAVTNEERARLLINEAEVRVHSWRGLPRATLTQMRTNRVSMAAGAFAYRWFLAIFPIIIALLGIATLVTIPRSVVLNLLSGVTKALPPGAAVVFTGAISHATQRSSGDLVTTIAASVVGLWSATSGMVIVEEGLDMAYGLAADRSFIRKRAVAIPLLLGAVILGSAASTLIIFGPQLGTEIRHGVPIAGSAFSALWTALRWLLALGIMNLLMSLLYYIAPNRPRSKWRWTSAGALVATILWAVVSLGFSFYTSKFGSYGTTYGAFAGVAILIFWLYLTGLAILIGGEVDAAIERFRTPATQPHQPPEAPAATEPIEPSPTTE